MLEIKNLVVQIEDKRILNGLDLTVHDGEVAAIMGPNGSGKSTLSYVLAGKADYEVLDGEVLLDGENILELAPDERAAAGLFLAFQYPLEIPGVATMTFLKAALNAQRKARGEAELTTPDFIKRVNAAAAQLEIPKDMLKRGAQRRLLRRREEAHGDPADGAARAALLHPRRDRFRPRHRRAAHRRGGRQRPALARARRSSSSPTISACSTTSCPTRVHVMSTGRIVKSGGKELALELEANGYADYRERRREAA